MRGSGTGRVELSSQTPDAASGGQLGLFDAAPDPILAELGALDLQTLTPLEALNRLHGWQQALRARA